MYSNMYLREYFTIAIDLCKFGRKKITNFQFKQIKNNWYAKMSHYDVMQSV